MEQVMRYDSFGALSANGRFVNHSDYAKLQSELDAAKAERDGYQRKCGELKAEWADVTQQLVDLRSELDAARGEKASICIYCGKDFHGTVQDQYRAALDHDKVCPKNPVVAQLASANEKLATLAGCPSNCIYQSATHDGEGCERCNRNPRLRDEYDFIPAATTKKEG